MGKSPNDDDLFSPPPLNIESGQPEVQYDFSVELDGDSQVVVDHEKIKRKNFLLLAGASVGLILLALLVTWLIEPNLFRSGPVRTTIRYYEYLNDENYQEAVKLLEPGSTSSANLAMEVKDLVEKFLPWDIPYTWDFQFMEYKSSRMDGNTVEVKADGYLRIVNTLTERNLDLPYSAIHTLVHKNGRWYIRP